MSDKITVAAQVICYINAIPIGQVTGFRFSSSTTTKEQFALDSLVPYELSPTIARVAGSVNLLRLVGDGGLEGQGIITRFEQLPLQQYFTLTLKDRFSDNLIFESHYCVVTEQSWDVPSKGVVSGSFTFTGISWQNEVRALSSSG